MLLEKVSVVSGGVVARSPGLSAVPCCGVTLSSVLVPSSTSRVVELDCPVSGPVTVELIDSNWCVLVEGSASLDSGTDLPVFGMRSLERDPVIGFLGLPFFLGGMAAAAFFDSPCFLGRETGAGEDEVVCSWEAPLEDTVLNDPAFFLLAVGGPSFKPEEEPGLGLPPLFPSFDFGVSWVDDEVKSSALLLDTLAEVEVTGFNWRCSLSELVVLLSSSSLLVGEVLKLLLLLFLLKDRISKFPTLWQEI